MKDPNTTISVLTTGWLPFVLVIYKDYPLGLITHSSVNWVSFGLYNSLSPGRRQAIIWTNADIFSFRPQGTYFNEILFGIQLFSFTKMRLNMSSEKWRPFCPGGDVLTGEAPPIAVSHWSIMYTVSKGQGWIYGEGAQGWDIVLQGGQI